MCTFLIGFDAFSLLLEFDMMVCLHLLYSLFLVFLQVLQLHIIMFLFGLKRVEENSFSSYSCQICAPALRQDVATHIHLLVKTAVHLISLGLQFGVENSLSTIGFFLDQPELAQLLTPKKH